MDGVQGAGEQAGLLAGGHHGPALFHEARQPRRRAGRGGAHGRGRPFALRPAEAAAHLVQLGAKGAQVVGVAGEEARGLGPARAVVVHQARAAQGCDLDVEPQVALPIRSGDRLSSSGPPPDSQMDVAARKEQPHGLQITGYTAREQDPAPAARNPIHRPEKPAFENAPRSKISWWGYSAARAKAVIDPNREQKPNSSKALRPTEKMPLQAVPYNLSPVTPPAVPQSYSLPL